MIERIQHPFSKRMDGITISPTFKLSERAKNLQKEGKDIINLTAGEPDFNAADVIKEGIIDAVHKNKNRYTPIAGIPELRAAIADAYSNKVSAKITYENVITSAGAKEALFNALMVLLNHGDEVIIAIPYWVTFPQQVLICGGKPVYVRTNDNFQLTPDTLLNYLSSKTKAIIINSPNNPSGIIQEENLLKSIVNIAKEKGIYLIYDETYNEITYDGKKNPSPLSLDGSSLDRIITVNTFSKTYAMMGLRIGYAIASKEIINEMCKIQGHTTSHPSSISQYAALSALSLKGDYYAELISQYEKRRRIIIDAFNKIPSIKFIKPDGAFYIFPDIRKFMEKANYKDSDEVAFDILEEANVAVMPGSAFGLDGYLRISFAVNIDKLQEACERLIKFFLKIPHR